MKHYDKNQLNIAQIKALWAIFEWFCVANDPSTTEKIA